ncbi:hypothetical protein ABZ733_06985 [Streptomyces longwoodensis]|uniref:hypothetical protein n=1 Tax=Streptomyces longwoodensis TaxID=68231 RepID=UPI003401665B
MTFPDFRANPAANNSRCAVHIGDSRCTNSAAWHLDLGATPDGARRLTFACDPHMISIQAQLVYAYRHPRGPACGRTPWEECAKETTWQAPDRVDPTSLGGAAGRAGSAMQELSERWAFDLHPDLQGPDDEPTP